MKRHGIRRKTVLEYAPMSNGRPGRTVGTVKKSIGRPVEGSEDIRSSQLAKENL